ncbi:MAG: glycosyltransferase [Oscillospiraceae bacterium]
MANIIITTHWLDGDVLPFMRIGRALKHRGHHVTIITHCYFEKTAQLFGLNFEPWDTQEEYNLLIEFMNGGIPSSPESDKLKAFKQQFESIPVRLKEYEKVLKHCQKEHTVIVAKCRSSIGAFLVAEKRQLPLVTIFMNPMEPVSMSTYNELYGSNDIEQMNELRSKVGLEPISSWIQWHSAGMMSLGLWPEWFANQEDFNWPNHILCVGFPVEDQPQFSSYEIPDDIAQLLNGKTPPIIISGGTTKMLNPKFYPASAKACGLMNIPTILLTRYAELVPEILPSNVKWCEYLPLDEILPKCQAIIHHGGIGTSSGSLKCGIPQLVLPFFGDGLFNGRQLKKLGIAECLPVIRWTPEYIKMSLEKLTQVQYKQTCREYQQKMEKTNAIDLACNHIEDIVDNRDYIYHI